MDEKNQKHIHAVTSNLEIINGVRFTPREIDLLACMLTGRSSKRIATFLSLSTRTIENYLQNIMQKIKCNSREGIINFLESSDSVCELKERYAYINQRFSFVQYLKGISKASNSHSISCVLIFWQQEQDYRPLASLLERDLNLAGINATNESLNGPLDPKFFEQKPRSFPSNFTIYIIPSTFQNSPKLMEVINQANPLETEGTTFSTGEEDLILLHDNDNSNWSIFFLSANELQTSQGMNSYYSAFQGLLRKIFTNNTLKDFIPIKLLASSSIPTSQNPYHLSDTPILEPKLPVNTIMFTFFTKKRWILIIALIFTVSFCLNLGPGMAFLNKSFEISKKSVVRSDLNIPVDTKLLKRPKILSKIDEKLKHQNGIQSLAIIGIGGSGKTTLAREYARSIKSVVVWEINAETRENILQSFECLAFQLSRNTNDKNLLKEIENIRDPIIKENQLKDFLKDKLRQYPDWLLIYDNVESISTLQGCYPNDPTSWGTGTIIITTRNANIQAGSYVKDTLLIGELTKTEKKDLFLKIGDVFLKSKLSPEEDNKMDFMLDNIPSYPLDISVAAHYINSTNSSYDEYLKNSANYDKAFMDAEESISSQTDSYNKTRHNIISSSLKNIRDANKDFAPILLLMCLINSQNIPKDLLDLHATSVVVDNLITNLKKHSLISDTFAPRNTTPTFSFHRSIQPVVLNSLVNELKLNIDSSSLEAVLQTLEKYIKASLTKEDAYKQKQIVGHCEALLKNSSLLNNHIEGTLKFELGKLKVCLGNFVQAKIYFVESIEHFNRHYTKDNMRSANALIELSLADRELGNYLESKKSLTDCLEIYKNLAAKNPQDSAKVITHLANVHRLLGDYKKSKELFDQALAMFETCLPENDLQLSRFFPYVANLYMDQGKPKNAQTLLQKSLQLNIKLSPDNSAAIAWRTAYLGNIYRKLGDYENARKMLLQSFKIYKEKHGENYNDIAWVSARLGRLYQELGNFKLAQNYLSQSLQLYEKYQGDSQVYKIKLERYLAINMAKLGQYAQARALLEKNLLIYNNLFGNNHIQTARLYHNLGETYLLEKNLDKAEGVFKTALKIFEIKDSLESYACLESLADLYIMHAKRHSELRNIPESIEFRRKALIHLIKGHQIIKDEFPTNSAHIQRLQSKIKKLEKTQPEV